MGVGRCRSRPAALRPARGPVRRQGSDAHRRDAAGDAATWSAIRGRSRTRSSSTRRAIGRSRSSPAGSGSSRRWTSAKRCWRAAASCSGIRGTCGSLRELGQRPGRRLVRQPPAVLRRAVPGVVSGARRRQHRLRSSRWCRTNRGCRSIRRPTCPTAIAPSSAISPDGFTGDPDVMDTWATSSLTPQIAGGWLDDPDLFARVFPMDLRPQAHDIIRTWLFATVLRSHLEHDSLPWAQRGDLRLGARSGPQEDVEVEGQRRHADGAARGARLRRRALLGGQRPARHRHRVRSGADESGTPAGDQAAERVAVRAGAAEPRGPITEPLDRGMLTALARARGRRDRAARGVRLRARAGADRDVLLELLRRLPRAGEGAALRRLRGRRRGVGEQRDAAWRCRRCCGCSRRTCRS